MENKKLPKNAYGGVAGKNYVPYINKKDNDGLNLAVLIIGIILAAIFAASTTYSGLKAGLTVAAGIPGAIIGGGAVAAFAKSKGILGTNVTQGMASGGESIASGMIFVLPSILIIGGQVSFLEGLVVGIAGALVGLSVSALVYNYLMVQEHGELPYPEAMAISETMVASDAGGDALKFMGIGSVLGGITTLLTTSVLGLVNNMISFKGDENYRWRFSLEVNPLLLGIGFIVGIEVAVVMMAGSALANFAISPLIGYFSAMAHDSNHVWNDAAVAIKDMDAGMIADSYSKYIGAGMMLCGGIIGAIKLIPNIITSVKEVINAKGGEDGGNSLQAIIFIAAIILAFVGGIYISNGNVPMIIIGTIVSLLLMFLFVIVAGRLAGTIGTSNLPVSGMTIASLVILTLVFVLMGWKSDADNKSLLLFGTMIVTAIAVAGGYNQSQKATFVIGGSKNDMQKGFLVASIVGVLVVTATIMVLAGQLTPTKGVDPTFAMPQANLMATLTGGIMKGQLPWAMIACGVIMALVINALKLPIMTFAVGFYIPISTTAIILVGALLRLLVEKLVKDEEARSERVGNGISLSSGLVAGGSIVGLIGIILQVFGVIKLGELSGFAASNKMAMLLLAILLLCVFIAIMAPRVKTKKNAR
jgi:putative OPT family oligopeptide transporter